MGSFHVKELEIGPAWDNHTDANVRRLLSLTLDDYIRDWVEVGCDINKVRDNGMVKLNKTRADVDSEYVK